MSQPRPEISISLRNERTDDELIGILDEPGTWIVTSRGRRLCFTATLRTAIERGSTFAGSGAVVTTLSRLSDNAIVPPSQMSRLRTLIADKSVPARIVMSGDSYGEDSPPTGFDREGFNSASL
jgi:hypothetical protein